MTSDGSQVKRRWRSPSHSGLAVLFALFAAFLIWLFTLSPTKRIPVLTHLGVPAIGQLWLDLRVIVAGIHEHDAGGNPYLGNPTDPLHRPFNYPRIWLTARFLTNGETALTLFTVVQAGAATGFLFLLIGKIRWNQVLLIAPWLFSPALILLMERSNTDLGVLGLLAAAAISASARRRSWMAPLLVAVAAILKLYPAVALLALIHTRGRTDRICAVLSAGAIVAWLLFDLNSTRSALAATPMGLMSYGVGTMSWIVASAYGWPGHESGLALFLRCLAAFLMFCGMFVGFKAQEVSRAGARPNAAERAFLIAGLVYVATFIAGSSFDYRVAIVSLAFRHMLRKRGFDGSDRVWIASWWSVVSILVWSSPLFGHWSIVVHQVASLALVPIFGYFSGQILRREYWRAPAVSGEPVGALNN